MVNHALRIPRVLRWTQKLVFWETGNNVALDAAVVFTAEDFEEAAFTPVSVPGVSAQPVGYALLLAPSHQLDCVAAEQSTAHVLIHARLVGGEVSVNLKIRLHGAVC